MQKKVSTFTYVLISLFTKKLKETYVLQFQNSNSENKQIKKDTKCSLYIFIFFELTHIQLLHKKHRIYRFNDQKVLDLKRITSSASAPIIFLTFLIK